MDKDVLLSCPFCGSLHLARRKVTGCERNLGIQCFECGAICLLAERPDEADLVLKKWNTRPPQERCELVKLDRGVLADFYLKTLEDYEFQYSGWINKETGKRYAFNQYLLDAMCKKFGTAPAQKTLSLEEEMLANDAYHALRAARSYGRPMDVNDYHLLRCEKALNELISAIKAKMESI